MTTPFSQFDGPRLLRGEELNASNELLRICFEGPEIISKEEEVVARYIPPQRGGRYVLADQGKLVSQIEIFHDQIRLYDATIRVASIAGVCTHPDYQNKGLASHLLAHCTGKLVQEESAQELQIVGERTSLRSEFAIKCPGRETNPIGCWQGGRLMARRSKTARNDERSQNQPPEVSTLVL